MPDDGPMLVDLWLGGKAAERLKGYCAVTGKEPESVLIDLVLRLNPEMAANGNGHHVAVCGACGLPFHSARRPRDWEQLYCSTECRREGAADRQHRYREKRRNNAGG